MATITINECDVYISSAKIAPNPANTNYHCQMVIGVENCIPVLASKSNSGETFVLSADDNALLRVE